MDMQSSRLLAEALRECGPALGGTDWEEDAQTAQLLAGQVVYRLIMSSTVDPDHLVLISLSSCVGSTFDASVLIVPGAGAIEENIEHIDQHLRDEQANAYILIGPVWLPSDPSRAALVSVYSGWDADRALAWFPRPSTERSLPLVTRPDPGWCRLGGVNERDPCAGFDA